MSFLRKIKKVFVSNKILMMFLIMIFIKKILTKSKQITQRKLNYYSELYFTLPNEKGTTTVISRYFPTPPTKILLNGEIATVDYWGDIQIIDDEHENIITYIWDSDEQMINCLDMFKDLREILFINFTNFDLSQVTNMDGMFSGCYALTSIDFNSNVKINSLLSFNSMFHECYSLLYLDLNFMDTSSITDMSFLFADCRSLKYLDISYFNTTSVQTMMSMFQDCHSLSSLNLNNFNTSSLENMNSMFLRCFSLEFLYLDNFDTKLVTDMGSMFEDCEKLISLDLQNFETSLVTFMNSMFYNCKSLIFLRINFKVGEYLEIDSYLFPDINTIKICINDEFINFLGGDDYFQYKDYELNCSDICFQENKKMIIDKNKCVFNCFDDEEYILEYNNVCYKSCPEGTQPISDIKCIAEIDMSSQSSDSDFDTNNINIFNDSKCIIYDNYTFDLNEIITNIKNDSLICKLNLFKLFSKDNKDVFIKDNNRIYQITSSYNQYNNNYNNASIIILGQCEERLRKKNNITDNDLLLIFKMEIKEEGYLIPVVEYEVYDLKKEKKLDLRICEDLKIDILLPLSIDENNLFLYNISSEYYNDLCFPFTTENKTDIIIDDRRKEYIKNNLSLCERNCELNNYNSNEKKVKCKCPVKIIFPSIDEIIINQDSYLTNFADFRKISNLEVIKCYRLFFTENGFKKNIGNYILIFLIIFEIILAIIFKAKDYKIIIDKIYRIINLKKEEKNNEIVKDNNKIIIPNGNNNNKSRIKKKRKKTSDTQILKIENYQNPPKKTGINILFRKSDFTKKDEDTFDKNTNSKLDSKYLTKNIKNAQNPDNFLHNNNQNNNLITKIKNNFYNDYEMNSLNYNKALEIDKRTYLEYYFSLLREKHLVIFTFYTNNDYNSRIIKICLFLFSFALYYTTNGLFFTDSSMHRIYVDNGYYNLLYQLPQIVYSTIISIIINTIINLLSLTQKNIVELKNEEINDNIDTDSVIKCIKIKFIIFFILEFSFLLLFWLFLSCFCVVFTNTQLHLFKDTLISFGLALIYPLGINLIPGIFRLPALNSKVKNKQCIYILSKIIQLL